MSTPAKILYLALRDERTISDNATVVGFEEGMVKADANAGTGSDGHPRDLISVSMSRLTPEYGGESTSRAALWAATMTVVISSQTETRRLPRLVAFVSKWGAAHSTDKANGWARLKEFNTLISLDEEVVGRAVATMQFEVELDYRADQHPFDNADQ